MSNGASFLLDTCIWLDAFNARHPGSKDANTLIDSALARHTPLLYAMTSLKDVFYIIGLELKRAERAKRGTITKSAAAAIKEVAWGCVQNMLESGTPIALDYSDAWLAMKLKPLHDDLEDDLLIAALKRANAHYLVTTDQQLITHFPDVAIGPRDAVEMLEREG